MRVLFWGKMIVKVELIVMDDVGIGALPDSMEYNGITNCNTLKNIRDAGGD